MPNNTNNNMTMMEDELIRQTEILARMVAKTAAAHQKEMNNLMMKIFSEEDEDDSSIGSTSSSDTFTTVDSTVDDDDNDDCAETLEQCDNDEQQTNDDENSQDCCNRKRQMSNNSDSSNGSGSSPKRLRPCFDHVRVYNELQSDYLGSNPVYPEHYFQKRYGISLNRFKYILEEVSKQNHPFYKSETKETEPCLEAKLLLPLGALISGSPPDMTMDYFQMSEEMAKECCDKLDEILNTTFGAEYLRTPLASDLENIRKRHEAGPGMDQLFCTRDGRLLLWKECPAAWRDQVDGDAKNSPIVLKGVSDNQHWIWHAEFGLEDTANNLRVLSESPLPQGIKLKSGRRGVKRAFYVLQSKFQFLQRMWNMKLTLTQVGNRIRSCILLHNMIVSDKVMGGNTVRARYDPNFVREGCDDS